jgi:hypothetical protein
VARARNIKPGLFKNELLVEQPPFVRLLFIGLWTLADREGRLEDRPKRIKLELFPYDPDDTDESLRLLADSGFIDRYEAVGKKVIQIVNFLKHQTPHGTERDSDLPGKDGEYTVHERNKAGYVTGTKRNNNVNQSKNNVSAQGSNCESPVTERPDSPIHRFTDSPNKEVTAKSSDPLPRPPRQKKDGGFDMMKALIGLGVPEKLAADWLAVRKAKRAANTQTALDGLVREAGKAGISVDDAVRICGERGWQGFDSTWNWQSQPSAQKKTQYQINQEATARAFFGSSVGADEPRLIQGEVIR